VKGNVNGCDENLVKSSKAPDANGQDKKVNVAKNTMMVF